MILHRVNGVYVYPDGREVCDVKSVLGRAQYRKRTLRMLERQSGNCGLCGKPLAKDEATFDHTHGRGMGGAKRDDRIEIDGHPVNCAAHLWCNSMKGSK